MNFKKSFRIFFISLFFLLTGKNIYAKDFLEKANKLVYDFSNVLSQGEENALESKLVAYNDSTSTEIAVVITDSTGEYEIADYSVQLFNQWKIGKASKNNGVLLLVSINDHKVWITTGFAAEGALTDALSRRIIELDIVPAFKRGDFYSGLDDATTSIMKVFYSAINSRKIFSSSAGR